MIILFLMMSAICALALAHLLELGWSNCPPAVAILWSKSRALRLGWAVIGILVVISQVPAGILIAIAGLPVCLTHLNMADRNPAARLTAMDVACHLYHAGRDSFRRFLDRTRIGPH